MQIPQPDLRIIALPKATAKGARAQNKQKHKLANRPSSQISTWLKDPQDLPKPCRLAKKLSCEIKRIRHKKLITVNYLGSKLTDCFAQSLRPQERKCTARVYIELSQIPLNSAWAAQRKGPRCSQMHSLRGILIQIVLQKRSPEKSSCWPVVGPPQGPNHTVKDHSSISTAVIALKARPDPFTSGHIPQR